MSDIKDKLASLLARHDVVTGKEWRRRLEEIAQRRAAGEFEIDKIVPGTLIETGHTPFYLVQTKTPLTSGHGNTTLDCIQTVIPEHLAIAACDADLEEWHAEKAVFLDVETTGLAGGTGTVAFLVGLGYMEEGTFCVDQCFMRDFDDEPGMLEYVCERLKPTEILLTYNGKSFDVPLLHARFIQNRLRAPLDRARHIDLLHAVRRIWKMRLADCSLGNVEREILGLTRHGDIPSEEIPEIWLEYVRTRDARKLDRVFYHHRMDIVSLVTLTAHLSRSIGLAQESGLEHGKDQLSLVRLLFRQRAYPQVVETGKRLLETQPEAPIRGACMELMGLALKRMGDWEEMEKVWKSVLITATDPLLAYHELAKLYEHRMRNLSDAESICVQALQYLDTRIALRDNPFDESLREAFEYRLERIRRKMTRSTGDTFFDL